MYKRLGGVMHSLCNVFDARIVLPNELVTDQLDLAILHGCLYHVCRNYFLMRFSKVIRFLSECLDVGREIYQTNCQLTLVIYWMSLSHLSTKLRQN
jgi:hypothetical protein